MPICIYTLILHLGDLVFVSPMPIFLLLLLNTLNQIDFVLTVSKNDFPGCCFFLSSSSCSEWWWWWWCFNMCVCVSHNWKIAVACCLWMKSKSLNVQIGKEWCVSTNKKKASKMKKKSISRMKKKKSADGRSDCLIRVCTLVQSHIAVLYTLPKTTSSIV